MKEFKTTVQDFEWQDICTRDIGTLKYKGLVRIQIAKLSFFFSWIG